MNSWITIRPPVDQCLIIPLMSSSCDITISEEFILPSEPTKNNLNLHIIFSRLGLVGMKNLSSLTSTTIIQGHQLFVKSFIRFISFYLWGNVVGSVGKFVVVERDLGVR